MCQLSWTGFRLRLGRLKGVVPSCHSTDVVACPFFCYQFHIVTVYLPRTDLSQPPFRIIFLSSLALLYTFPLLCKRPSCFSGLLFVTSDVFLSTITFPHWEKAKHKFQNREITVVLSIWTDILESISETWQSSIWWFWWCFLFVCLFSFFLCFFHLTSYSHYEVLKPVDNSGLLICRWLLTCKLQHRNAFLSKKL